MNAADPSEIVTLDRVGARLSGRHILRDVDLQIGGGEFIGLIGSNGAGKTTLLRVILGLVPPSSGNIRFGNLLGEGRKRRIGYVPQKITLDSDIPMRGRDLIALGIDGNRLGIRLPSASRSRLIDEMIDAVNARSFANTRVGNMSGGEQQRVLIAHALISRPRLLLLDEPLANLDIRSEQEVVGLVARIAHEQDIAVLISTHDMNPLLPVMDRIAYIADGRVASGTPDEIVTSESLSRLYRHHVDVIRVHDRVLVVAAREGVDVEHGGAKPVTILV